MTRAAMAEELGRTLVAAWGSWGPSMTPEAQRVAFISDRDGSPRVYVQDVPVPSVADPHPAAPEPLAIRLSDDPVVAVSWSADSAWLACLVATGGGVRTQVWVVRPDGTDARRVAGDEGAHAELGPWTRSGHRVVVTVPGTAVGEDTVALLANPATGDLEPLASGELIHVLDLSVEERAVVLRDGPRGHQFCTVVDRLADRDHPLLTATPGDPAREGVPTGATEIAILRPSPAGDESPLTAYLVTEAGLPRRQLVAQPIGPDHWRGEPRVLAARDDAELEALDADDAGQTLLLVWNASGRSELELLDTGSGWRRGVPGLPGLVASSPVLSRDGASVLLAVEGPERPRELWRLDVRSAHWNRVTQVPDLPGARLVVPTLETFTGEDGLPMSGWLYAAADPAAGVVHLHGGPESQERPTFQPQHQALAAAGVSVFAPNVRGSSGFGREFVHADDLDRRYAVFGDVVAARDVLVRSGAPADRVVVTGRSYGGYLTHAALAFTPGVFAAGIAVCGMSDLRTFYRDTEPWIAAAAVTKYGHPERDAALLERLSPMTAVDRIDVPLLVVHGEHDTNVPIGEAEQMVAALRARGRDVSSLVLAGEGHEYRRAASRERLVATMLAFLGRTVLDPVAVDAGGVAVSA
jgi:dipeptidyl aminopeptidase/acylaminoacyl peptidase